MSGKLYGKNIDLPPLDNLFSSESDRQDAKLEKVQNLRLDELFPFREHPFHVRDDEEMDKMVESIREYGILTPAIVRPRPEGGYELVSGQRRHHGCARAGLETMPCIVREMDDDTAPQPGSLDFVQCHNGKNVLIRDYEKLSAWRNPEILRLVNQLRDSMPLEEQRILRFITPEYDDLFTIKDGESIRLRYHDGSIRIMPCRAYAAASMQKRIESSQESLRQLEKQLQNAQEELQKPFAHEQELADKSKRLAELNALLNMNEKENAIDSVPDEESQACQRAIRQPEPQVR